MRIAALVVLTLVYVLMILEGRALRGELASVRFYYLVRMAEKVENTADLNVTITSACNEAELVKNLAAHNPDALGEVTSALLDWTMDPRLSRDLRTRIATKAIGCAVVSVQGAPSDYLTWLALARTYFTLGMWDQTEITLDQARSLVRHRGQVRMFAAPSDE